MNMKNNKFIIGVPKLKGKAVFVIDINGIPCEVTIDEAGCVRYVMKGFLRIDYGSYNNAKFIFDTVEDIVKNVFEPYVFKQCGNREENINITTSSRNARSGKRV
jgi:hypothetical protein